MNYWGDVGGEGYFVATPHLRDQKFTFAVDCTVNYTNGSSERIDTIVLQILCINGDNPNDAMVEAEIYGCLNRKGLLEVAKNVHYIIVDGIEKGLSPGGIH